MREIKAFVGHSFAKDDAPVVALYLKYFEQLTGLLPNFSWEHAEAAEPIELAEKVKYKIADKNVFIGICTRKELAISESLLTDLVLRPDCWKGHKRDFEWKTSDWIIQEIGLAIGRGLEVVLLLEEAVRRPGGLQGNKEYIEFNRENPELTFGKIVEMLSALSPKPPTTGATADRPKTSDDIEEVTSDGRNWNEPKPNWQESDYRHAVMHLIAVGEEEKITSIQRSYVEKIAESDSERVAAFSAHIEFLKILFGKTGSLDKIVELAESHPESSAVLESLAKSHAQFDDHIKAAQAYENAARAETKSKMRQFYFGRAAIEFAKAGLADNSIVLIEGLKIAAKADKKLERNLASAIRDLAKLNHDDDALVSSLERIVELTPDDYDDRFSLAYKHSEMGNDDLALSHYLKIPYASRTAGTWNNIGVAYDHFSMPGRAVRAYRMSEEMGDTLAMSNLGQKFIRGGFVDEAQAEFDRAIAIKDYHKNVVDGLGRLKQIPDEEEGKENEVLKKLKPKGEFFRLLGQAISLPNIEKLPAKMNAPESALEVVVDGDKFTAHGEYERDTTNYLAVGLLGALKTTSRYRIEYQARIVGRQIEGTVSRVQLTGPKINSLLSLGDLNSKVLMYLDGRGSELRVMENPTSITPSYYSLTWDETGAVPSQTSA